MTMYLAIGLLHVVVFVLHRRFKHQVENRKTSWRTEENLQDLGLGVEFLDTTRSIINERKIGKSDAMKS